MGIIYAILASFIVGAGISGTLIHKLDKVELYKVKAALEEVNTESTNVLKQANFAINLANVAAIKSNQELDNANFEHIKTINTYYDMYHTAIANRVRNNSKSSCENSLSKGISTKQPTNSTSTTNFPEGFGEFLADQAERADKVAVYAGTCRKFVIDNNCGVMK